MINYCNKAYDRSVDIANSRKICINVYLGNIQ